MANIEGSYKMIETDGYDKYLKGMGVGAIKRTMASKAVPTMEYTKLGENKYRQKTIATLKTFQIEFVLGEEFDETLADDRVSKSVITLEGNKLVHKIKVDDVQSTVTRVFNGDTMETTFQVGDVTATRKFQRV